MPNHMYEIQGKYTLLSYFLHVKKQDQIIVQAIHLELHEYIIYDGPGLKTNAIKTQSIQKSSTFQCLIHLMKKLKQSNGRMFQFHSEPIALSDSMTIIKN